MKKDWCLLCLWCNTKNYEIGYIRTVTSERVVFAKYFVKGKSYPLLEGILETCKDNILEYKKVYGEDKVYNILKKGQKHSVSGSDVQTQN